MQYFWSPIFLELTLTSLGFFGILNLGEGGKREINPEPVKP